MTTNEDPMPDPIPAPTTDNRPKSMRKVRLDDPQARQQRARDAIAEVLAEHRCRILPTLTVEPVGASQVARQALVAADWIVVPEA